MAVGVIVEEMVEWDPRSDQNVVLRRFEICMVVVAFPNTWKE